MKQVLGLDIGVSSVGWAVIKEDDENHKIIEKIGVRVVPDEANLQKNFVEGKTASKNADRRTARGIRRNNQRFKLRRNQLHTLLAEAGMLPDEQLMQASRESVYAWRARAVTEKVALPELGRVFLLLNQRRGFLSNRKAQSEDESNTDYKKQLAENESALGDLTIGQYAWKQLARDPHFRFRNRVYLRKTYRKEFDAIWEHQKQYYPEILTGGPDEKIQGSLYEKIAVQTIFFQRPLKSQKHLVAACAFERQRKVIPKSSPLFQVFRIHQMINNFKYWRIGRKKDALSLTETQRNVLFDWLNDPKKLDSKGNLKIKPVLQKIVNVDHQKFQVNFQELLGNRTLKTIKGALEKAGVTDMDAILRFDPYQPSDEGLMRIWHLLYSVESDTAIANALQRHFGIPVEKGKLIAATAYFEPDYGSVSAMAIRKILPHLQKGLTYDKACVEAGYQNPEHVKRETFLQYLPLLQPNELRNPVVEQILNQVINVVNSVVKQYGPLDEIRVELARELKNNAKTRQKINKANNDNQKTNDFIRQKLVKEHGMRIVNGRDLKRYKLWQETNHICLYCLKCVKDSDLGNGGADADHILPKSRTFNDSMHNLVITHAACNRQKGQLTAYDYVLTRGEEHLLNYIQLVNKLLADKKISKIKHANLLTPGDQIESGFLERQIKDTQYIAKKSIELLKQICPKVNSTTGAITSFLREKWGLNRVLQELVLPLHQQVGLVEHKEVKNGVNGVHTLEVPKDWSKRDDHRHHAVDALVTALTDASIIFRLNNLNKIYQLKKERENLERSRESELTEDERQERLTLLKFAEQELLEFPVPIPNLRHEVKKELESILISIKKKPKVLSPKWNVIKTRNGKIRQKTYVPRFSLHEQTVHGTIRVPEKVKITTRFSEVAEIKNPEIRELIRVRLETYGDPGKAFKTATLKKDPLLYRGKELKEVEVWVKKHTKRVKAGQITDAQIKKIVDQRIKRLFEERLAKYDSHKAAFQQYDTTPEYHDRNRKIPIKSVTIFEEGHLIPLRENETVPVDFVYTGGNHHALIYKDQDGNYHDRVVSRWEATQVALQRLTETGRLSTVIDRTNRVEGEKELQFVYDLQMNDLVLIDFDFDNLDVQDEANFPQVSKRLFRVQKMSKNKAGTFNIMFRHHLESTLNREDKALRGITWEQFQSNKNFARLAKVQVNNLGQVIAIHRP